MGSMQLGKSAIIVALSLLMPLIHATRTEQGCIPFILIPPKGSLRKQMQKDIADIWQVFKHITVNDVSVGQYYEHIQYRNGEGKLVAVHHLNDLVVNRSRGSWEEWFKEQVADCIKRGYFVISLMDESHWGQDVESPAARMEREFEGRIMQIGISATPSEQMANRAWQRILAYIERGYVGPRKWCKVALPCVDDSKEVLPELYSFGEFFQRAIIEVADFKDKWNLAYNTAKWEEDNESVATHQAIEAAKVYLKKEIKRLGECLVDAFKRRPSGIFLRSGMNNAMTQYVVEELRKGAIKEGCVIPFFGNNKRSKSGINKRAAERSVKEEIKNATEGKNVNYLVIATAKARMGDSFPSSCRTFIDLTNGKNADFCAMAQGTYGRACGYHKDSVVILSADFKRRMQTFVENGCEWWGKAGQISGKPNARTRKSRPDGLRSCGANSKQLIITDKDVKTHPKLVELFSKLSAFYNQHCTSLRSNRNDEMRWGRVLRLFNEILNEEMMTFLEQHFHVRLLRWGQEDKWLKSNLGGMCLLNDLHRRFAPSLEQYQEKQKEAAAKHSPEKGSVYQQIVWTWNPKLTCLMCRCKINAKRLAPCCRRTVGDYSNSMQILALCLRLADTGTYENEGEEVILSHENTDRSRYEERKAI